MPSGLRQLRAQPRDMRGAGSLQVIFSPFNTIKKKLKCHADATRDSPAWTAGPASPWRGASTGNAETYVYCPGIISKIKLIQNYFPGRAQHLRVPVRLGGTAVRQAGL